MKLKIKHAGLALLLACSACAGTQAKEDKTKTASAEQTADTQDKAAETASIQTAAASYSDVPDGLWYSDAVAWCKENGIMTGTGANTFSPDSDMNRAMFATVLYRAQGEPETASSNQTLFPDVAPGQWYSDAIAWARDEGVITGYASGLFGPSDPLTREQTVTILWRRENSPAVQSQDYSDEAAISSYARAAVDWARENGIMTGVGNNRFDPQAALSRAQAATLLQRVLDPSSITPDQDQPSSDTPEASEPEQGESVVYFTDQITPEGMMEAYEALNWSPQGNVAVKLSTGEPPASNYLQPSLIKDVVQHVNGTIVENNTAYGGSRSETAMHYQVAKDHGFTDIANFQILDENGSLSLPVNEGDNLKENLVGQHFDDYDSYLVLSHFKGHAMAGYGGAIKNISIGLASSEGKGLIHSGGTGGGIWGGDQNAFLESMAEAGKSVSDHLNNGKNITYINVMNRLSVDCDCDGNPAEPDMHDIGILASNDPVALDQACLDLVYAQKDGDGASLVQRIESRNGLHTLEQAEKIGLGSRSYKLVSLDS